jgi:hypothetical protein
MSKLPLLHPGEMTEDQLRQIQFLVCAEAVDALPNHDVMVGPCAAGCRRHVVYTVGYPDRLPKVCLDCSDWLMECEVC